MKKGLIGIAIVILGILILQTMPQSPAGEDARVRNDNPAPGSSSPIIGFNGWEGKQWYSELDQVVDQNKQVWLETNLANAPSVTMLNFRLYVRDARTSVVLGEFSGSAPLLPFIDQATMSSTATSQTATYVGQGFTISFSNAPTGVRVQYQGSGSVLDGLLKSGSIILYNATNMVI